MELYRWLLEAELGTLDIDDNLNAKAKQCLSVKLKVPHKWLLGEQLNNNWILLTKHA